MSIRTCGFIVVGASSALLLFADQARPKVRPSGANPQVQTPSVQATTQPHPEIVPLSYLPPLGARPGKLVVRAWNPTFDARYSATIPVNLRIQDLAGRVRTGRPGLIVPSLGRLQQTDLTFDLTLAGPATSQAGVPQVRRQGAVALAAINLQAETVAIGQTGGPKQSLLRWPQGEAYRHEPLNVHGAWSRNADMAEASFGSPSVGDSMESVEEHTPVRASPSLTAKMSAISDSPGEPPPASIVLGSFLADVNLSGVDTNIAVGPNAVLVSNSSSFAFSDRAGQPLRNARGVPILGYTKLLDFFQPLHADLRANLRLPQEAIDRGYSRIRYYDARCAYDPYRNRFWIICLANNKTFLSEGPASAQQYRRNKIACAVSKTSDPRDGFWLYWWDGGPFDGQPNTDWLPGDRADYPSLGISPRFMMQSAQVPNLPPIQDAKQSNRWCMVSLFNADALAAGRAQFGWMFHRLVDHQRKQLTYLATPATHYGPSPQNRAYLLKRLGTTMLVYGFDAHLDFPKSPRLVTFPVRDGSEIKVMEQSPSADVGVPPKIKLDIFPIPMRAIVRDNRLWTVMPEAALWPGQTQEEGAVRYIRASLATFGTGSIPTTPASGFIEKTFGKRNKVEPASATIAYGMPTIDVDRDGNAVIGYLRSNASMFAEVRFSVGYANESDVRPSMLLQAGQGTLFDAESRGDGTYGQLDCTGAALDPDGKTIWLAVPFAWRADPSKTYAQYRTVVARIRL